MVQTPVYLDNHATTRCDPRVVEAMLPFFTERYGNAASKQHAFGRDAEEAVEAARAEVAAILGAQAKEIVFTSGATESDNLALRGAAGMFRRQGTHLVTTTIEHRAVLDTCRRLEGDGFSATYVGPDRRGVVEVERLAEALRPDTILVSVMAANNEVGTIQHLGAIGRLCKDRGVLFHTDATQAVGKLPLDVEEMGIDLLSLSAHKIFGPKGVGALYVRRRSPAVRLQPLFDGGGHERGMRSGTSNVPGIVGLGMACRLCREEQPVEGVRLRGLRDRLHAGLTSRLTGLHRNGHPERCLDGNLNLSFEGVRGEALLMGLRNVAVSSGSACTSVSVEPSYVLRALGIPDDLAQASLRFGLGRFTTEEEIDFAVGEVVQVVERLRKLNPENHLVGRENR